MNKKAYMRTVEAVIAIIILIIFIFTVIQRPPKSEHKIPLNVQEAQNAIIKEATLNNSIRNCIITNPLCHNSIIMQNLFQENIPVIYNYTFKICEETTCLANTPFKTVYVADVFISSTYEDKKPKILRFWIWEK